MFCSFIPTLFSFSQKNLWHNMSYTWPSSLAIFVNILGLVFNLVIGIFKPSVVRQVRELCTSYFLAFNTELSSSFQNALHPTFLERQCTFCLFSVLLLGLCTNSYCWMQALRALPIVQCGKEVLCYYMRVTLQVIPEDINTY